MSDRKPEWRRRAWWAESHELTPPSAGKTVEEWWALWRKMEAGGLHDDEPVDHLAAVRDVARGG